MRLCTPLIWLVTYQLDELNFLNSIGASQAFEALNWDFAAASHELDELCLLGVVEFLEYFPEPLNHLRLFGVVFVHHMLFQVLDINRWQSTDQELKLSKVENLYQVKRHELMEAMQESINLCFDAAVQSVVQD